MSCLLLVLGILGQTLMPAPQTITPDSKDAFRLALTTPVVVADDVSEAELAGVRMLIRAIGLDLPIHKAGGFKSDGPAIHIGEPGRHASFEKRRLRRFGEDLAKLGPGGYRLNITKQGVVLAGVDRDGTWNGLQTLLQIVEESPAEWRGIDIRDWPALGTRGAWLHAPPTPAQLAAYARLKCNTLYFDTPDFFTLEGGSEASWRQVFDGARALRIEPVPVLRFFSGAEALLRAAPLAAEGRTATEPITLHGDDWARLGHGNVLATKDMPIQVSIASLRCEPGADYELERGTLEFPFSGRGAPWLIRRIPGGRIPDGATVSVVYGHVPPESAALCPHAPETRDALKAVFARLHETLRPAAIAISCEDIGRINQDLRCLAKKQSATATFLDAVNLIRDTAKAVSPAARIVFDQTLLRHAESAAWYGLDRTEAVRRWPADVSALARVRSEDAALDPGGSARLAVIGPDKTPARMVRLLTGQAAGGGVLVEDAPPDTALFRAAMEYAWTPRAPFLWWPHAFNTLFQAELYTPKVAERVGAIAAYLNRRTVRGETPERIAEDFAAWKRELAKTPPFSLTDAEFVLTEKLFNNLAAYLALESQYTASGDSALLKRLAGIVGAHAELDPDFTVERRDRILSIVESQQSFAPASIVFGTQLLYHRPVSHPGGMSVHEVPATPEFRDLKQETQSTLDLGGLVGPICRVDFETAGSTRIVAETRRDSGAFETLREWTGAVPRFVRGPALLSPAPLARTLRFTASTANPQAVLREMRVFALKGPASAECLTAAQPPPVSGSIDAKVWPAPQVIGFLNPASGNFAEAPTEARMCRTRTHLYIGIRAGEARMGTLAANHTRDEAPLWEEESVEVWIGTGASPPFRLAVNPNGARFDSNGGDAGWNGTWQAAAARGADAWIAVLAVPFKDLGTVPKPGDVWKLNVKRTRANVTREESYWAHGSGPIQFGELRFR